VGKQENQLRIDQKGMSDMSAQNQASIEHVIVLMLENRSYDHMLGYLPNGGGLAGDEFNQVNPADPASEQIGVTNQAEYITTIDPAHDFVNVAKELFGPTGQVLNPAPMNGFVANYVEQAKGNVATGKTIMQCFDPDRIPALATLAQEFCICDRWFAAVPGPTWVNRFFAHTATSDGLVIDTIGHDYNMKTIYELLGENKLSWNIYYGDFPQSLTLQRLWPALDHFRRFDTFHSALENGDLAAYTFIEPRFLNFHEWQATDQHPPHDVRMGEYLLAEVYDNLRSSPFWETSLLVVLYDEHGGFFDHVSPPSGLPNPDGKLSANPPFDFTRLGVRVPAVLISPWIEKCRVDSTIYEHSSLPATIRTLFNLPGSLTARDAAANTFEKNLTRSTPRQDTPLILPVPGDPAESQAQRALLRTDDQEKWRQGEVDQSKISQQPLSIFQEALVELAGLLNRKMNGPAPAGPIQTEHAAALHIYESLTHFLER
jgi:phospholipase C